MKPYNGHKNYNHWNVSLWINNDEGLYRRGRELLRIRRTKERAAEALLQELPSHTPDDVPFTKTTVLAALRGL